MAEVKEMLLAGGTFLQVGGGPFGDKHLWGHVFSFSQREQVLDSPLDYQTNPLRNQGISCI